MKLYCVLGGEEAAIQKTKSTYMEETVIKRPA